MTDRINALTVILERDFRIDDIEPLVDALRQMRGVLKVQTNAAEGLAADVAEASVKSDLYQKIHDIFYP